MSDRVLHHALMGVSMQHRQVISKVMFHGLGVTRGQPKILMYLRGNNGCMQRQMAEDCHMEPASVTGMLQNMEKRALLRREPDETDKRVQRVYLTEDGEALCARVEQVMLRLDERLLEGFSPEERESLFAGLERLKENMQAVEREYHAVRFCSRSSRRCLCCWRSLWT